MTSLDLDGKFTPISLYSPNQFVSMFLELGWEKVKEQTDADWNSMAKISGRRWAGSRLRFENRYGSEFVFLVGDGTLSVWTLSIISIATEKVNTSDKVALKRILDKILLRSEEWSNGKVHCSDCDTLVNYQDIKRNIYYAGIYCQHCWDTKWKTIEAKETYN